jgi:hypothetical protein
MMEEGEEKEKEGQEQQKEGQEKEKDPLQEYVSLPIKKRTILEFIKYKLGDQDFNQKMSVAITVVLEMYRILVSSFLVLFVPQKCGEHVCSLSENMVLENELYSSGLVFNFITMASFLAMYTFEIKRENRLITYLEVNKSVPTDNSSVGLALELLQKDKRDSIWALDKYYQYSGWASIILFVINTILSGFVVYNYYLDSQTTSTYITNILFMITKLADVHTTVNTEKNVFYSAYMKGKVQYNDVDPDKVVSLPLLEVPLPEEEKIIVTVYDISSNPSSSNDLPTLDQV